MIDAESNLRLPSDLLDCESSLIESLKQLIPDQSKKRLSIDIKFEGLKIEPVVMRLLEKVIELNIKVVVAFSDFGSCALAKRDYPKLADKIYTFKELSANRSEFAFDIILAISPQPYDFDMFELLCSEIDNKIIMINGKLEETAFGVGFVGRERRTRFIKSWFNLFHLEPLNNGALYHKFPLKWCLYKYTNSGYLFLRAYDGKPDSQLIDELLI